MSKHYEKPVVIINDELAEGVYAASGCYTVTHEIVQWPETGRGSYCIQVKASHDATHHSSRQVLSISFNHPVTYESSKGTLVGGNGTNTLLIEYGYHSNFTEGIGLGNIYLKVDAGLSVLSASLSCDEVDQSACPGC